MSDVKCEVPGCDREFLTVGALGPHYSAHRRKGDAGVPAAKYVRSRSGKSYTRNGKRHLPAVQSKAKPVKKNGKAPEFASRDVVEMGLLMMFPVAVPRERVYEVMQWVNHTESLARTALGA